MRPLSGRADRAGPEPILPGLGARLELESDVLALIPEGNETVDALKDAAYDRIKQAIADGVTQDIGYMINLLLISRHIERLADHATNIAEEVIYLIEGEIIRHGKYL